MLPLDKILRFIFILLLISPVSAFAQPKNGAWRVEGPRFGVDLSRFLMPSIRKGTQSAFEIQADYPWKGYWFPTIEAGYQAVDDSKETFHYTNKGAYARIGLDLNIKQFESLIDHDLVLVGVRYGFSRFSQETLSATYTNYWSTLQTAFPQKNMNAHWAELVFGLKGELFPNIFFGWTVRGKFKFAVTKDENITPYVVPGLGYTGSDVPFDFSLTLSYRIPLFKSKTMPKPIKMGGASRSESDNEEDPELNNQNGNSGRFGGGGLRGNLQQY